MASFNFQNESNEKSQAIEKLHNEVLSLQKALKVHKGKRKGYRSKEQSPAHLLLSTSTPTPQPRPHSSYTELDDNYSPSAQEDSVTDKYEMLITAVKADKKETKSDGEQAPPLPVSPGKKSDSSVKLISYKTASVQSIKM